MIHTLNISIVTFIPRSGFPATLVVGSAISETLGRDKAGERFERDQLLISDREDPRQSETLDPAQVLLRRHRQLVPTLGQIEQVRLHGAKGQEQR